jgi:hypothetical protein
MFEQDPVEIEKQTGSIKKIFFNRCWANLAYEPNTGIFVLSRHGYPEQHRIYDAVTCYGPRGELLNAFQLFCTLADRPQSDPNVMHEYRAIQRGPEPEPVEFPTVISILSPNIFARAREVLPLDRLLDLHNVPYKRTESGTILFELSPQGLRRQYATHPGFGTFNQVGISAQKLTSYDLWRLVRDREQFDRISDRKEFIEFVRNNVSPEVAAQLSA